MNRKLIETSTLIIGSGLAAQVAKLRNPSAAMVDSSYIPGGLYAQIETPLGLFSRCPAFSENPLPGFIETEIDVVWLKEGYYEDKVYAYEDRDLFQRPRFLDLVINIERSRRAYFSLTPLKNLIDRPRSPITANIRVIDLERNVAALSNGIIVRFNRIIYTWPLDRLPMLIRPLDKELQELLSELRTLTSVRIFVSMLIVKNVEKLRSDVITLFLHGTKASRLHTIIAIPLSKQFHLLYVFTSFGPRYGLLPGIIEKFFSELRKFLKVKARNIVDEYHYEYSYLALSKISEELWKNILTEFKKRGIRLWGRLGLWREMEISSITSSFLNDF